MKGINKKNFLILLVFILAIIALTVVAFPGCDDPDGQDRYTEGTCTDDVTGSHADKCTWNDAKVREYYCSGDLCNDDFLSCGSYCCSGGKCDTNISASCSETDAGQDEDSQGTCTSCGNSFTDTCNPAQTQVREYYCSGSHCVDTYISCGTNCCVNGECDPRTSTSCSDSDGGQDEYTQGQCLSSCSVTPYSDECNVRNSKVREYYCSGGVCQDTYIGCGSYCCSGGICDTNISASCSETDGGRDEDNKGTCTSCGKSWTDECNVKKTMVRENYCSGNHCVDTYISCPGGCEDGECKPVVAVCGNGTIEGGEECDPPASDSSDCPCPSDSCKGGDDYYNYPDSGDCNSSCACNSGTGAGEPCEPNISYNDARCVGPPPPPPPPPPTCTRASPTVTLSPSPQSGNPGDTLSYTVSVYNRDSATCAPSLFNLTESCPSGWTCSFNGSTDSLNISPGSTETSSLSVTSPSTALVRDYTVSVTATNSGVPSYSDTGSGIYTIAVPRPPPRPIIPLRNPLTATSFEGAIANLIDVIFYIAFVVVPLMIIYAGFLFVTAGGNVAQIAQAKRIILWTVIGLTIVLLSKGLLAIVQQLL